MSGLEIRGLSVSYGGVRALEAVDLSVASGEIVGIIGESGSGKSTLAYAIPRLLPPNARVTADRFRLGGVDLLGLTEAGLGRIRGRDVAMVFQDPATSFSPLSTIGTQLEAFVWRDSVSAAVKRRRVVDMLASVGIGDPERRARAYPHEMSGGMLQRVSIAAALLARPKLIIADEPTTALDVTTEAQILHLLREIRTGLGASILVISHQLGVIAEICDRVAVMYQGIIVEDAPVETLFHSPRHPYTQWLMRCEAALLDTALARLPVIPGLARARQPNIAGCRFAARCAYAEADCRDRPPPRREADAGHAFLCWREGA